MEYFHSWMYPLSHELILHSIRNPLVSGFYKLLSVTMKIAKRIKYYQVGFLFLGYLKNEFCQLLMKQEYQVVSSCLISQINLFIIKILCSR